MGYIPDPKTIARKLRGARMAAASAVANGATPEQVREAVEQGIAEAIALVGRMNTADPAA